MTGLTKEQADSIKKSYLNILALFFGEDKIESRYLKCLLRWGFELDLDADDLKDAKANLEEMRFTTPADKLEKFESIYHLVHMICMDQRVEDVELEIASLYASRLGFKPNLVSELLRAIVTADGDGDTSGNFRQQVVDFLNLNEGIGNI